MQDVESSKTPRMLGKGYSPHAVRSALRYCLIAWIFGAAFFAITGGAAFTSFLTKYLHTDDTTYGLIFAAGSLGVVFQLLGSFVIERTGRVKRHFLIYCTLHRLLWLGVAAIPLLLPVVRQAPARVQILLVLLLVLSSAVTANYGSAGWAAWMSDLIPRSMAGKFFGYRARLGLISMVVAAIGVAYLLDRFEGQGWMYALVFGVAALLGGADILCFLPAQEVPRPVEDNPPTMVEIILTPWRNELFRRFALYTVVTWIAYMMMGPFVWRYCYDTIAEHGLNMSVSRANMLLFILPNATMALMAPFWGRAIDRFGPKPVLAVCALSQILVPLGWVFMRPAWVWGIVAMAMLGGLTWPGIDQVNFYMQLKVFPDNRRTTYIAMFAIVAGLAVVLGTTFGGYYASFWQRQLPLIPNLPSWISHYHPVFLTSILLRAASFLILLPRLPLPGVGSHVTVARQIASD
ncbi:MAG TPA: MFS transporter, partial [Armatimonadota bacterium]